ncbi:MAG: DUF2071 domain-containing protein [Roseiflexaceae bacterium]
MTITETAHRPWPLPRRPWVMAMEWHDLLFMHWPVAPAALRALLPPGLELETFDGQAWLGVVPFWMRGVRARATPALPWVSAFPELNVRTYVRADDRPGVWFFSLDAANPLAVQVARATFHLPYFDARMAALRTAEGIDYRSTRTHRGASPAEFAARYRPIGPVQRAAPGSFDAWLTERYCLYAANRRGRVWRGEIHHAPWPLQPAEAEVERNSMAAPIRLRLPDTPPLLHFARRLDVLAWLPERVGA